MAENCYEKWQTKKLRALLRLNRVAPAASFGRSGRLIPYGIGTPRIGGRRLTLTPSSAKSHGGDVRLTAKTHFREFGMGMLSQLFNVCLPRPKRSRALLLS